MSTVSKCFVRTQIGVCIRSSPDSWPRPAPFLECLAEAAQRAGPSGGGSGGVGVLRQGTSQESGNPNPRLPIPPVAIFFFFLSRSWGSCNTRCQEVQEVQMRGGCGGCGIGIGGIGGIGVGEWVGGRALHTGFCQFPLLQYYSRDARIPPRVSSSAADTKRHQALAGIPIARDGRR